MFDLVTQKTEFTMTSYDFLNEVINPARMSAGERPVENRKFVARVEDELDDLGAGKTFPRYGNTVKYYDLNMEQMTLVGMRESKAVRRKVLEMLKKLSAESAPSIPQSFSEALQLAANQAKQLEKQAPKVEFVDRYVKGNGLMTFRQVCKLLNVKETEFRSFLVSQKIMYRLNGGWAAYQVHLSAGRFQHKAGIAENGRAFSNLLFTAKGVNWVAELWSVFNRIEEQV